MQGLGGSRRQCLPSGIHELNDVAWIDIDSICTDMRTGVTTVLEHMT